MVSTFVHGIGKKYNLKILKVKILWMKEVFRILQRETQEVNFVRSCHPVASMYQLFHTIYISVTNATSCMHIPGKQQCNYTSWVMGRQPNGHIQEKSTFTPTPTLPSVSAEQLLKKL
jgi:hypothetical protein